MTTSWVADYTHRIPPSALKAAGVVGVCRYLAQTTSIGKIIGKTEYDELVAAGVAVVLNWEQNATDWLGGASAGKAHGTTAAALARALGYPTGRPIPGSADFDMSAAQWASAGKAYAVAYRDALHAGGYTAGVYGGWDVLSWCRDLGGFDMFWQSMSTGFSGGRNRNPFPGGHLLQHAASVTVGGQDVDRNDIRRPDWANPAAPQPVEVPEVEQSDALQPWSGQARAGLKVGWVLGDQENLRDWWLTPGGKTPFLTPPAGSPADLLFKFLQSPAPVTLSDAQVQAIADRLVASAANGLTPADHAGVVADVKAALATGELTADVKWSDGKPTG